MTAAAKEPRYLAHVPLVLPARITIEHLQLRDILQPSSSKGKLLYLNHLTIDEIDFENPKQPPKTFCSLDFRANCLVTGHGLLAAGGQFSELAIRPLAAPSPSPSGSTSPPLGTSSAQRQPTPWLLRTPTGGSINNSVAIHPDPASIVENKRAMTSEPSRRSTKAIKKESTLSPLRHTSRSQRDRGVWFRDAPHCDIETTAGYPSGDIDEDLEAEALAAAYGFERDLAASSPNLGKGQTEKHSKELKVSVDNESNCSVLSGPGDTRSRAKTQTTASSTLRVYCSNNDRSLKVYKLRPPSGASSSPALESGLPGLTRSHTLEFPTAVNHCSFSPDGRTLLAVGDTPHVFLYHRHPTTGAFSQITTYKASSDASFSTSWHPDGTKFAVASQDGIISVWDVRSSKKLAELKTSQSSTMLVSVGGMNAASGAARVVKFSPCGRYLAFTEHRLYFHVYDTLTYSRGQRIRIPTSLDGDGIETVQVHGNRELVSSSSANHFTSTFPESRERRTGLLESRLLTSLYGPGRSGSLSEGLFTARRHMENLTSSLRLPSLDEHRNPATNSSTTEAGNGNPSSPATGANDSAVNALREAQRSLRAVRERIAARSRQAVNSGIGSGIAAGVGISGPFDPFVSDSGLSLSPLGTNFFDGEEDIAAIRRSRRISGQADERGSDSPSSPVGAETLPPESGARNFPSIERLLGGDYAEAANLDPEEDRNAPESEFIRRRRDLSRFLPRPNEAYIPNSSPGGRGEFIDASRLSRIAGGYTTSRRDMSTSTVSTAGRFSIAGRVGNSTDSPNRRSYPLSAEVYENELAEVLDDRHLYPPQDDTLPINADPDGEEVEITGAEMDGDTREQEVNYFDDDTEERGGAGNEGEEEGVIYIDDYPPDQPSSRSSSRLLPPSQGSGRVTNPPLPSSSPSSPPNNISIRLGGRGNTRVVRRQREPDSQPPRIGSSLRERLPRERPNLIGGGDVDQFSPLSSAWLAASVASDGGVDSGSYMASTSTGRVAQSGTQDDGGGGGRGRGRGRGRGDGGREERGEEETDDPLSRILYPSSPTTTTSPDHPERLAARDPTSTHPFGASVGRNDISTVLDNLNRMENSSASRRSGNTITNTNASGAESGSGNINPRILTTNPHNHNHNNNNSSNSNSNSNSSTNQNDEGWLNISGLTWDPEGEYLYVSSERCICRYSLSRRHGACGAGAGSGSGEKGEEEGEREEDGIIGGWERGEVR